MMALVCGKWEGQMAKAAVARLKGKLVVSGCCISGPNHQEAEGLPWVRPPIVLVRVAWGWCPAAGLQQVALE